MIGIDIGSSSCKIGVFNISGTLVYLTRKKIVLRPGKPAESENYPELLWKEVLEGLQEATGFVDGAVSVIGLTGQIGTDFFIDKNQKMLLPPISWKDSIGGIQADTIWKDFGQKKMDDILGLHIAPSASWPIARFAWLRDTHPDFFSEENKLLQPKDYIGFKLTGNLSTDLLSLRGLVNPKTGKIDEKITKDLLHVGSLLPYLPDILTEEKSILGTLGKKNAAAIGLSPNTPVVVGCGDFHCSLLGSGIIDSSNGFNITGTSEHIGRLLPHGALVTPNSRLGCYPSIDKNFDILYGATSAGGGSMNWFLENICTDTERKDIRGTVQDLFSHLSGAESPIFLPYLNGERAPIWNTDARGTFFGLNAEHTKGDLLKAILEGVGFSLYDNWSILNDQKQADLHMLVSGTAANDEIWNQIKADIFGTSFINMKCNETSCLGAAILGACGIGQFSSLSEAVENMTAKNQVFSPNQNKRQKYMEKFLIYRELYQRLIPLFETYANIGRNR